MTMKDKMLNIINYFGLNTQQRKLQEEIFELQESIIAEQIDDYANYTAINVLEELGDVRNVLDGIQYYYGISDERLTEVRVKKLNRTLDRIETGYYDKYNKKEELVRKSEREKVIQDIKNEFWINDGDNDFISIKDLNLTLDKYLKLKEE